MSRQPAPKVTVGQFCINVSDVDRSVDFYVSVVGLRVLADIDYEGLREVQLGSSRREPRMQLAHSHDVAHPIDHGTALQKISIHVDDCGRAHRRAIDAGWPSVCGPVRLPDHAMTYALVEDPDGYLIELLEQHAG